MEQILVVVFMLASVGMVALILMQHGKGADAGAAFGSGASATRSSNLPTVASSL